MRTPAFKLKMKSKIEIFLDSLKAKAAPPELHHLLVAVWHGLRGEWDEAHNIAQDDESKDAAWIHAWLHRQEGDLGNAAYWYSRAQRPIAKNASHESEGREIAEFLLSKGK